MRFAGWLRHARRSTSRFGPRTHAPAARSSRLKELQSRFGLQWPWRPVRLRTPQFHPKTPEGSLVNPANFRGLGRSEDLSREEHDLIKDVHPAIGEIREDVAHVKGEVDKPS
jgi:hypothetical protein